MLSVVANVTTISPSTTTSTVPSPTLLTVASYLLYERTVVASAAAFVIDVAGLMSFVISDDVDVTDTASPTAISPSSTPSARPNV